MNVLNLNKQLRTAAYFGDLNKLIKLLDDGGELDAIGVREAEAAARERARRERAAEAARARAAEAEAAEREAEARYEARYAAARYAAAERRYAAAEREAEAAAREAAEAEAREGIHNRYRGSALHFACFHGRKDIVEHLLGRKADVHALDTEQQSAIEKATEMGHTNIVQLLEKALMLEQIHLKIKELEGTPRFPMYVCEREGLLGMEEMQKHEAVVGHEHLMMILPANTEPKLTLFVSHRWTSDEHPDKDQLSPEANNKKIRALQILLQRQEFHEIKFIWIDYLCIPQDDPTTKQLAIDSLPYYAGQCGQFLSVVGNEHERSLFDEYQMRGWCMLEVFSSFSKCNTQIWRYNVDEEEENMLKHLSQRELALFISNPLAGHFTGDEDNERRKIAPMLHRLCDIVVETSKLSVDDETCDCIIRRVKEIQNYILRKNLM